MREPSRSFCCACRPFALTRCSQHHSYTPCPPPAPAGSEYDVFEDFLKGFYAARAAGGSAVLPDQVLMEVHWKTHTALKWCVAYLGCCGRDCRVEAGSLI